MIHDKVQDFSNSCGACALLVTAKELGIQQMSDIPSSEKSMQSNQGVLVLNKLSEEDIYRVTSGSTETTDLDKAGYSMPSGIVKAAKLLGLQTKVTKDESRLSKVIENRYPDEETKLKSMGNEPQLASDADKGHYRLEVMIYVDQNEPTEELHWVVKRPDGSYMNPGTGKNANDSNQLNEHLKSSGTSLMYTGISVIVWK